MPNLVLQTLRCDNHMMKGREGGRERSKKDRGRQEKERGREGERERERGREREKERERESTFLSWGSVTELKSMLPL